MKQTQKRLMIEGIEFCITRKQMRSIRIRVSPLKTEVGVSAPHFVKEEEILAFIRSKLPWIHAQRQRQISDPTRKPTQWQDGEIIPVWGIHYTLKHESSDRRSGVRIVGDRLILTVSQQAEDWQKEAVLHSFYRTLLREQIPRSFAKWEPILGVKAWEFGIKNMKTRWGSCNTRDHRIWINLQLAKKPPRCLDYIVVHELVHLLERGHGQAFQAYMNQFLPDWRIIKKELNHGS